MLLANGRHQWAVLGFIGSLVCTVTIQASGLTAALSKPSPYLTRAEAAAILLLSRPGELPTPDATQQYDDVLPNDWFRPTILAAAKIGVISADATGKYVRPLAPVNRAAFLKMLTIAFNLPTNGYYKFTDVPSFAWYAPYAGVEATYHLFTSSTATRMEPEWNITQAEAERALKIFLDIRNKAMDAQLSESVQLYTRISTKRIKLVIVPEGKEVTTISAQEKPAVAESTAPTPKPATLTAVKPRSMTDVRSEVITLVNAARANKKLLPLISNATLEQSAQTYAEVMATGGFFGHTDKAGNGPAERINAVGYADYAYSSDCQCIRGFTIGENLARGQKTAIEVVKAWMASPSHREAILGSEFQDIGIGISAGVWVMHLGGVILP